MGQKAYIFVFILAFIANGCDIFKTRDPENPIENKSNFLPPITSDIVLSNLKNSIIERNSLNYIQCFSTNNTNPFQIFPPAEVKNQYQAIFIDWDLNSEKSYFENLIAHIPNYSSSDLTLNGTVSFSSTDSVTYNADYILSVNHNIDNIPKLAKGNLQFILIRDKNNNWSISRWYDNKLKNEFCWSEIKARFSN